MQAVVDLFNESGLKAEVSPDIRAEILRKFMSNVWSNPLGALTHLARSLDGVGEHQLLLGRDPLAVESEEAFDDDPGLAAARPGQHQAGSLAMVDGGTLIGVEGEGRHSAQGTTGRLGVNAL